jgi:hypothetical protein
MRRIALVALVGLSLLPLRARVASAQPKLGPPPSGMPPSRPSDECADFRVESLVSLNRTGGMRDDGQLSVDFMITVSVLNPCPSALDVQYGSFLGYETNFPSLAGANQPAGCEGQRWSFSGPVPPHQNAAFTLNVRGCRFPSSAGEQPRVSIESGRTITDRGEKPVPAVARVLP